MNTKMTSLCCKAKARLNLKDSGWWCTACGKECSTKSERAGFGSQRSTLSNVRKPTGERDLFATLWAERGGVSEVSGKKLPAPKDPLFHFCGSHLLPKGTYPDYRLDPRNIVMMLPEEHEHWHATPKGLLLADPKWAPFVAKYKQLQQEAERKYRVTDTTEHT